MILLLIVAVPGNTAARFRVPSGGCWATHDVAVVVAALDVLPAVGGVGEETVGLWAGVRLGRVHTNTFCIVPGGGFRTGVQHCSPIGALIELPVVIYMRNVGDLAFRTLF